MRLEQSLQLRRLVVLKSQGALYDQRFHLGVNIIRGDNSSGKSTIADFIFFSLGGELKDWTPQAESADSVHAEVSLGSRVFTLSRDVEISGNTPMYFFEGDFDSAMSKRAEWLKYPYARSANSESFSQILFRLLRLPEQKTEGQQNITMHQVLRLLYCDQMTPVDRIFRSEKFDPRETKIAVAELLLGFDDLALHDIRLRLREADRKYGEIVGELKSIFQILGKTADSDVTVTDFQRELDALGRERQEIAKSVADLSYKRDKAAEDGASEKASLLAQRVRSINQELNIARQAEQEVLIDIEDSEKFVSTLRERIDALESSKKMADVLGAAKFSFCPSCLAPIDSKVAEHVCHLCKSELLESGQWGYLKMREELVFQIRESTHLLAAKAESVNLLSVKVKRLESEQERLLSDLREFERSADPIDAEMSAKIRRMGYIDRSVEDLARKAELAAVVKKKISEREALAGQLQELRDALDQSSHFREQRRSEVGFQIVELCVDALHHDLPLEEVFREAELVQFDFGRDRLAVNGRTRFSASSATYLKNAFLFSLFELSLVDKEVRWPRFILLDNIEDKGMQPERSANFQEYVVSRLQTSPVEHQVIMTTSMISPRLENSVMCVGPHYTKDHKTLRFSVVS